MDVFEAVRTILAVRDYADRPVPEDLLRRVVEAGRLTASAANKQPWHFVVVRERRTLEQLAAVATSGPYLAHAPVGIAVAVRKTPYAVSDASRAIQSMLLVAWSEGVGSNWVGFGGLDAARALLGVPEELDILGILAFGYPAKRSLGKGKKRRKPLAEVAHRERFGTPFA